MAILSVTPNAAKKPSRIQEEVIKFVASAVCGEVE